MWRVKPAAMQGFGGRPAATWPVWSRGRQTQPRPAPGRSREEFVRGMCEPGREAEHELRETSSRKATPP